MEYRPFILVADSRFLTETVKVEFRRHYETVEFVQVPEGTICDARDLDKKDLENFTIDLLFKMQNPKLGRESLCCHLDNYSPKNNSQEQLLYYAQALLDMDVAGKAAGIFMYGDTGVGKTHVSVAITKELMKRSQEVRYINASDIHGPLVDTLGANQVSVLDDLNSPYGNGMTVFKQIVLNAHDHGGRVFVTSNTHFDELMEHGFVVDKEQRNRFMDRIKGMFKVLHVEGESARQENPWFNGREYSPLKRLRSALEDAVLNEDFELAARLRDEIRGMPEVTEN